MPKPRRTQAERIAASDSAMFKAAIDIIARDGPNKMTLAKVGKASGYSGSLVTYRFGSKVGLLQAVCERIVALWIERELLTDEIRVATGIERLKVVAEEYIKLIHSGSKLMIAIQRLNYASYESCPELRPIFEEIDQKTRQHFADELAGEERLPEGFDALAFTTVYLGALRGVAQQYAVSAENVDLEAIKQTIWTLCDNTLIPPSDA